MSDSKHVKFLRATYNIAIHLLKTILPPAFKAFLKLTLFCFLLCILGELIGAGGFSVFIKKSPLYLAAFALIMIFIYLRLLFGAMWDLYPKIYNK